MQSVGGVHKTTLVSLVRVYFTYILCVLSQRRERGGASTEGPDSLRPAASRGSVRGEAWTLNW